MMSKELAVLKTRLCCVFHKEQHIFGGLTGKGEGLESLGLVFWGRGCLIMPACVGVSRSEGSKAVITSRRGWGIFLFVNLQPTGLS